MNGCEGDAKLDGQHRKTALLPSVGRVKLVNLRLE
jgi:hypothetical protein